MDPVVVVVVAAVAVVVLVVVLVVVVVVVVVAVVVVLVVLVLVLFSNGWFQNRCWLNVRMQRCCSLPATRQAVGSKNAAAPKAACLLVEPGQNITAATGVGVEPLAPCEAEEVVVAPYLGRGAAQGDGSRGRASCTLRGRLASGALASDATWGNGKNMDNPWLSFVTTARIMGRPGSSRIGLTIVSR